MTTPDPDELRRRLFPILVTGRTIGADQLWLFAWEELEPGDLPGDYQVVVGGRHGTLTNCPAVSLNNVGAQVNDICLARLKGVSGGKPQYELIAVPQANEIDFSDTGGAATLVYVEDVCPIISTIEILTKDEADALYQARGTLLTVAEVDGSPSGNAATILIQQGTGLYLASVTGGVATLALALADDGIQGSISNEEQYLGAGVKRVRTFVEDSGGNSASGDVAIGASFTGTFGEGTGDEVGTVTSFVGNVTGLTYRLKSLLSGRSLKFWRELASDGSLVDGGQIAVDQGFLIMRPSGPRYTDLYNDYRVQVWFNDTSGGHFEHVLIGSATRPAAYGIGTDAGYTLGKTGTSGGGDTVSGGIIVALGSGISSVAWSIITGTPTTLSGYGITDGQPLDATLTSLSGQNWSQNAIPIGSGSDTLTQVSFSANTFPARASTGNLVAKTISDFGLSLVDDANAGAALTTLGGTTVGQSFFALANPSAVTFPRINNDNTVTALSASAFRTAIGAGTGTGDLVAANNLSELTATAGTARTNLGLGTAAVKNTGTSGNTVPLLDGNNTWSDANKFFGGLLGFSDTTTNYLFLKSALLSADHTLTVDPSNANRNLSIPGDATISGVNSGDQTITLTSDVTGSGTGSFATTIATNVVTDAKIRQSAGLSVIGRSANTTGNVADITAASDAQVLRRSGTAIGFGAVDLTSSNAATGALRAGCFPALTGDITTSAGALATTLKNTGTAGTYTKVTTDAQGRVSSGTTLSAGDLPGSNWIGNSNGEVINTANHTIVSASGTYEDIAGLTLTLPAAGTYLVSMVLRGQILISAGSGPFITCKLLLNGSDVTNSEALVVYNGASTTGITFINTITATFLVTAVGAHVVKVQGKRDGTTVTWSSAILASDSNGRCSLKYVRIA